MVSPHAEKAIEDATRYGCAFLKFIAPNDVGLTGGHQYGYYLPKSDEVWPVFTPQPPTKGMNHTHPVKIIWQNGRVTDSNVKWYGQGTRSEYRITGFGRDFPYISHGAVGDLLVLIPIVAQSEFFVYSIDLEEDIEELALQLGISPAKSWMLYLRDREPLISENECIDQNFRNFARSLDSFPPGEAFSAETWRILEECLESFRELPADEALFKCMATEFDLFKYAERKLCQGDLIRFFKDVDDFIATAQTILQRRKSRAGRSLENHVEHYLIAAGIPHKMRPRIVGKPDVVIPSEEAYEDPGYSDEKLFLIAVKTTCKDRWAQVLKEGKRVKQKHLLTFQKGMAVSQLQEMQASDVQLVVPKPLHSHYPSEKKSGVRILSVQEFIDSVRERLN